jgi:prolyl oligopeptidase
MPTPCPPVLSPAMRTRDSVFTAAAGAALGLVLAIGSLPAQPVASRRPVTDRYPGRTVVDPYRWMERTASRELATWLHAQDVHTSATLALLPERERLAARVRAEVRPDDAPRRVQRGGRRLFYYRRDADSLPPTLRMFDLDTSRERALLGIPASARHDPSPDGQYLAVTRVSDGRVLLVATADSRLVDSLPRGASFAGWRSDAVAVLYQRVGRAAPTLRQHRIGTTPSSDSTMLRSGTAGLPAWRATDALVWHESPDGRATALRILRDESVMSVYARVGGAAWRRVAGIRDTISTVTWYAGQLFLLGADGVRRFDPTAARFASVRSADGRALLGMHAARDGLYVLDGTGGQAALWRWHADRQSLDSIALPVTGGGRSLFASPTADGVVLPIDRWLGDGGWYHLDGSIATRLTITPEPHHDDRFLVERRIIRSHDGMAVPMTIVRRRDLPPGAARLTWVMAYGAYGITMTPISQSLGPALVPFLEDGGVYVVAHVRGGGEYGAAWHAAGRAAAKPNGYLDLVACVESLIASGTAESSRLVIEGSSGGGATVGMAGVKRPELFRVVITNVPDANTLRLHATPDGPYMREEWGDIRTPAGTRALAAMDVAHHVVSSGRYPAWWATTALRDESVPPWQPAKLIAHLQAVPSSRPTLLRVFPEEGHVLRGPAHVSLAIDLLSFAYWQAGVPEYQPPSR